jgi:hypothetical protein
VTDGNVIGTRHRGAPDMVPQICAWFEEQGFEQVFVTDRELRFGVGVHRFTDAPDALATGGTIFTFVGHAAAG